MQPFETISADAIHIDKKPIEDYFPRICIRESLIKERDPHGIAAHDPGAKLDAGKLQAGLLSDFSRALRVVNTITMGCDFRITSTDRHWDNFWSALIIPDQLIHNLGEEPKIGYTIAELLAVIETDARTNDYPGRAWSKDRVPVGAAAPIPFLCNFSLALMEVAKVSTYGADKYSRGGWQHVPNGVERYWDAFWRHMLKMRLHSIDPDSGLPHIAQMAWNLLACLELHLRKADTI